MVTCGMIIITKQTLIILLYLSNFCRMKTKANGKHHTHKEHGQGHEAIGRSNWQPNGGGNGAFPASVSLGFQSVSC